MRKKFVAFFPLDGIKKCHELFPTPNTSRNNIKLL